MTRVPPSPPTTALPLAPARPAWPVVLGVLAIIFGVFGVLQGCGGGFSVAMIAIVRQHVPPDKARVVTSVQRLAPWIIANGIAGASLGALLLVAGIALVARRAWSARALVVWSLLKIPFVLSASVLGYLVQHAQLEAMEEMVRQDPSVPAAMPGIVARLAATMGVVMVLLSVLWGWALPVFVLIWLSRRKVREDLTLMRSAT